MNQSNYSFLFSIVRTVRLSIFSSEPASWEVVRPLHQDALGAWVPHFPESESRDIAELAPMLRVLGYNLTLPESKISTRST